MGQFLVKLKEDKYVLWSTAVDAPVTYVKTRTEMLKHKDVDKKRMERADKNGTSTFSGATREDLLAINRAGKNEVHLELDELIEHYTVSGDANGL